MATAHDPNHGNELTVLNNTAAPVDMGSAVGDANSVAVIKELRDAYPWMKAGAILEAAARAREVITETINHE